jgi:carbon monoxide dehydrogenase subunit G
MDMTGEYRIPAPRQRVWEALNDPEVLKASIPGCEELHKRSDNELEARVKAKVGPVSATFTGKVTLNDLNPPESYTIAGEGKGGAAGFARGGAEVALAEDGADTVLRYHAKADVGGKLAQIGSRLIQSTAKKMADDFFSRFTRIVSESYAAEGAAAAPAEAPVTPVTPAETPPAAAAMPVAAAGRPAPAAGGSRDAGVRAEPAAPSEAGGVHAGAARRRAQAGTGAAARPDAAMVGVARRGHCPRDPGLLDLGLVAGRPGPCRRGCTTKE